MADDNKFEILIDTCSMGALTLYVDSCRDTNSNIGVDINILKRKYKKNKVNIKHINFNGINSIKVGYKLFNFLKNNINNFELVNIYFSRFSEVELLSVILNRIFDQHLTNKLVSYRIRRKKCFRTQIDFNYEEKVFNYWNDIRYELEDLDIIFICPESGERIEDVIKIAQIITKFVALDPVDLYLYALGIFLRVDVIYTTDEEFRKIIININSNERWKSINNKIQEDLKEHFEYISEEYMENKEKTGIGKIKFPIGKR